MRMCNIETIALKHASKSDNRDLTMPPYALFRIVKDATIVNNFMRKVGPSLSGLSEVRSKERA